MGSPRSPESMGRKHRSVRGGACGRQRASDRAEGRVAGGAVAGHVTRGAGAAQSAQAGGVFGEVSIPF